MPRLRILTRIALKDQPADDRDIPELPPGHLRTVDTSLDIRRQPLRTKQLIDIRVIQRYRLITQQLEPIVIHRKRKTDRRDPADPIRQQRRHGLMHQPPFKRIYKKMKPVLGLYLL